MSQASLSSGREEIAHAIRRLWWLPFLRGILLAILGSYALFRPGMTLAVLAQVIGVFVAAEGILCIIAALMGAVPSRFWLIVRGILEILVGIFVAANPMIVAGVTATVLIYMLAFSAIFSGILEIIAAIQDRKEVDGAGWLVLSGGLAILFGILVFISPLAFGLLMVRMLGVFAIVSGIVLVVFAFRVRKLGKLMQTG